MNLRNISFLFLIFIQLNIASKAQDIKLQANLGHAGSVTHIEFSPDGRIFASASTDHSLKLWDSKTCREIHTLQGHNSEVQALAFSPDGTKLVSSDENNTIVWDIQTGEQYLFIEDESAYDIAFLSEKHYLTGTVFLHKYNLNKTEDEKAYFFSQEQAMIKGFVSKISVSPNGKIAAVGDNSSIIHIIKVISRKRITDLKGHSSEEIKALCFNHDGRFLASGGHGPIKIWDSETYKEVKTFRGHSDIVNEIDFSSDGKILASVSDDGKLIIWDVEKAKALFKKTDHKAKVLCVDISPDGKTIITGGEDKKIRVWDALSGREITHIGDRDIIHHVSFSRNDQKIIAQSKDMSLKTWQSANTDLYTSFNANSGEDILYGFDKEGKLVFSYEHLWSVDSSKSVINLEDHSPEEESIVLFSSDNKAFYLEETFGVKKIDKFTGEVITEVEAGISDKAVAVSPDDSQLLCSEDNEFEVYSIKTGKLENTFKGHSEVVLCLAIDPYGLIAASGSADMNIKIWDMEDAYELQHLEGHKAEVTTVAFSPSEKIVASGSRDNTIKLWNFETGELIKSFDDHSGSINFVSFNKTGQYLLSASEDGSIKLWDIKQKSLIATIFCIKNSSDWIAVSPDGKFDGTPGGMQRLHVVKENDIIPLPSLFEKYYSPKLISNLLAGSDIHSPEINLADIQAPPIIDLDYPLEGDLFKENEIDLKISWPEFEDDIQEVLVYHNNKLEKRIYGFTEASDHYLELTTTLQQGENFLKVIALNSQRTESVPHEITVYYDGVKATSDLHLIVIGVDKHMNPQFDLKYAVTDANAFKEIIEGGTEEIFDSVHTHFLINERAKHDNIIAAMEEINSNAKTDDVFLFYFAGHGTTNLDSVPEFYLISHDVTRVFGTDSDLKTNGLSGTVLKEYSEKIKARKQLFIIDACQSGAIVDVLSRRGFERDKAIAQLARSTGTFWIVASESEQYALEVNQLGHGLFTYAILQGLDGKAEGSSNDKKITVKELNAFINDFVPEFSKELRGTAQYPTGFGYGQDFPLILIK